MNKLIQLISLAISVLIVTIPAASATQVNIMFNGITQQTVSISPQNLVNKKASIQHDPNDITWSKVNVLFNVNSASLAHNVEKIYVFKCKTMDPVSCSNIQPIVFEAFADTELLWSDISDKEGTGTYPQTAHIMTLVKLKGSSGETSWAGFWDKITRTDYNIFTKFNFELDEIDFHTNSFDFITPTANFINNFQMIPFNWASKVVFRTSPLYAIGGDETELESSILTSASPSGETISSINKDFFFVSSQTSSGITNFVSLNKNPSFSCGDNVCDTTLGESFSTCCYDCGCSVDKYCDIENSDPETSVCKSTDMSLSVVKPVIPQITECSEPINFDIVLDIKNSPSSLPETVSAVASLDSVIQSTSCTKQGTQFVCPMIVQPKVNCGSGSFTLKNNSIEITTSFNNGPNMEPLVLSSEFSDIIVNMECGCPEEYFCDSTKLTCEAEGSISLTIINVTSYIPKFNPAGDYITINAKINNPPSDVSVTGVEYTLGTLLKDSDIIQNHTTGSVTCSDQGDNVYNCKIPFSISSYDHNYAYFFKENDITFSIAYSNVGKSLTKQITSSFADITIPSYQCGDGICNVEESQENCCVDCGCPQSGMYCDSGKQYCDFLENVDLEIVSVDPTDIQDCLPDTPHNVQITSQINNPPSDINLDFAFFIKDSEVQPFPLVCDQSNPGSNTGLYSCDLTLPDFQECQETADNYVLYPNELNFTVSFSDGNNGLVTKTLNKGFSPITITPIYKCGDGVCETILGEDASNCCLDCACELDSKFGEDYYCNIQDKDDFGTCNHESDIKFVIDSPTAQVSFDSCEKSQDVKILAHIENEPSNMLKTVFSATLNNENAEYFSCKNENDELQMDNSIVCTLKVPKEAECSKGETYVYSPNEITATMAFKSGQTTRIISASDQLPDIVTNQKILSLFDITQDAVRKFRDNIDRMKSLMNDLLDWMDTCIDITIALALLSVTMMIALPIMSGLGKFNSNGKTDIILNTKPPGVIAGKYTEVPLGSDKVGEDLDPDIYTYYIDGDKNLEDFGEGEIGEDDIIYKTDGKKWWKGKETTTSGLSVKDAFSMTVKGSQVLFEMWSKICQLISERYQLGIEMIEIQNKFLQAELCMDIVQHTIDLGVEAGQEQGVFNNMVSCIGNADVSNSMGAIQDHTNQISSIASDIGKGFEGLGDTFGEIFSPDLVSVSVSCDGFPSGKCCGFGKAPSSNKYNFQPTNLKVSLYDAKPCSSGSYWLIVNGVTYPKPQGVVGQTTTIFGSTGTYEVQVLCGTPGSVSNSDVVATLPVGFCRGTTGQGCWKSFESGEVSEECKAVWDTVDGGEPTNPASGGGGYGDDVVSNMDEMINLITYVISIVKDSSLLQTLKENRDNVEFASDYYSDKEYKSSYDSLEDASIMSIVFDKDNMKSGTETSAELAKTKIETVKSLAKKTMDLILEERTPEITKKEPTGDNVANNAVVFMEFNVPVETNGIISVYYNLLGKKYIPSFDCEWSNEDKIITCNTGYSWKEPSQKYYVEYPEFTSKDFSNLKIPEGEYSFQS